MSSLTFAGLQKTTLIDYPGIVACSIFTNGCNLLCPYCHNSSLVLDDVRNDVLTEDELIRFLKNRKGILDGVCISGGEPLLHKEVDIFLNKVKEMGYLVKVDTNGCFPDRLINLVRNGLVDYIAMDVKNSPENYGIAVGRENVFIKEIEKSISFLMEEHVNFEFRTTAVKGIHTREDFAAIAEWIHGANTYYIQNYKDSGDTIFSRGRDCGCLESFTKEELEDFLNVVKMDVPNVQIRNA